MPTSPPGIRGGPSEPGASEAPAMPRPSCPRHSGEPPLPGPLGCCQLAGSARELRSRQMRFKAPIRVAPIRALIRSCGCEERESWARWSSPEGRRGQELPLRRAPPLQGGTAAPVLGSSVLRWQKPPLRQARHLLTPGCFFHGYRPLFGLMNTSPRDRTQRAHRSGGCLCPLCVLPPLLCSSMQAFGISVKVVDTQQSGCCL